MKPREIMRADGLTVRAEVVVRVHCNRPFTIRLQEQDEQQHQINNQINKITLGISSARRTSLRTFLTYGELP